MDVQAAARRWAETWARAWPKRDVDAITVLYANEALYRASVFREPDRGTAGVRRYLAENFTIEEQIECWFGEPIAAGSRATVEWWATWVEKGERLTLAGTSVLRFDPDGRVVDHRDYWSQVDRYEPPFQDW